MKYAMSGCAIDDANADDFDEYLTRRLANGDGSGDQELDVYTQLANKEKDLLLAAELGKALLEKNEELERVNNQLQEDYLTTAEQIEQQKHDFRFRLENAEREYELMMKELQADINMYRRQLENKDTTMKTEERERYQMVTELTKQNERLSDQVRKSEEVVHELSEQVQSLREQIRSRQSSTEAHAAQHDLMRDEITLLTEKQSESERRLGQLTEERDTLSLSLEECRERIHMLEKQKHEQEAAFRAKDQQIIELKDSNVLLEERLEDVYLHVSSNEFTGHNNSLFSELEMSSEGLDHLSRSSDNGRGSRHPHLSPHVSLHELDDDEIECDDDVDVHMVTRASSCNDMDGLFDTAPFSLDVRHEYIESYKLVRSLCRRLRQQQSTSQPTAPAAPADDLSPDLESGGLLNLLQEVREAVEELNHKSRQQYDEVYVRELDERIRVLSLDVSASRNQLECLRTAVGRKDDEIARMAKHMDELNRRLTLQQQEMTRIQKEKDDYNDQVLKPDTNQLVELARKERDAAIARRNSMELDLAKVKCDLVSVERQLMEAIHQKVALSEQLEQCQMDFESVLDFQIQKRFHNEVISSKHERSDSRSPKKMFKFLG